MPPQQPDWFAENAPTKDATTPASAPTDWFAENAPLPTTATQPALTWRQRALRAVAGHRGTEQAVKSFVVGAGESMAPALRHIPGVRDFAATPEQFETYRQQENLPRGAASTAGGLAAEAGTFAAGAGIAAKGAKVLDVGQRLLRAGVSAKRARQAAFAVEAGTQALGGGTAAAALDQPNAPAAAVISGLAPVASAAILRGAPAIKEKAIQKMASLLARTGVEDVPGPMVQHALKTGGAAVTSAVDNAVDVVRRAASDLLELPAMASWGKLMTTAAGKTGAVGRALKAALAGPLGDVRVPKQTIIDALVDLKDTAARHWAEVSPAKIQGNSLMGLARGGVATQVSYKDTLMNAIGTLEKQIAKYGDPKTGDMITVRNLTDLKRTWDEVVYTLKNAGKVVADPTALISTSMKQAAFRGANTIRQVLRQNTPQIADLNEAVHHAKQLESFVQTLYAQHPAFSETTRNLVTAGGMTIGAATAGPLTGGHILLGASIGSVAARVLTRAVESPIWSTISPKIREQIATAIVAGKGTQIVKLLTPFIARLAGTAEPPGIRPDLRAAADKIDAQGGPSLGVMAAGPPVSKLRAALNTALDRSARTIKPSMIPERLLKGLVGDPAKIGTKGFDAQRFPTTVKVLVDLGDDVFEDSVKGLNETHALIRAAANWPYAKTISIVAGRVASPLSSQELATVGTNAERLAVKARPVFDRMRKAGAFTGNRTTGLTERRMAELMQKFGGKGQ